MELSEMNLEQVNERLAQLDVEVREATEVDAVNSATEEKKNLLERKKELIDLEQRKSDALALENGEVDAEKIVEKHEERKQMEERNFNVDGQEYRNAWLKNLMGKELDAEERTAVSATAAIPTQTLNEIVKKFKELPLLAKIDMMQIPGYVRIAVESSAAEASWATTSTDSEDSLTYIDLTPYQLIKTVEVPATVDKMAVPAFESYIVEQLAHKIRAALQKAVINGSDSSQPCGIAHTISTITGTFTKAGVAKADILKIQGSLGSEYQPNACWIMPAKLFYQEVQGVAELQKLIDLETGLSPKLLGKEVLLVDDCTISSKDNIFYGDPFFYKMNLGEGVQVAKDNSVGFRSNSVVYRGVCLADGELAKADAFVRFQRAD